MPQGIVRDEYHVQLEGKLEAARGTIRIWKFVATGLLGAMLPLAANWALGVQSNANIVQQQKNIADQLGQVVVSEQSLASNLQQQTSTMNVLEKSLAVDEQRMADHWGGLPGLAVAGSPRR